MRKAILVLLALGLIPAFRTQSPAAESPAPPGPWQHPPDLGKPAGRVVEVRTEKQLQAAVARLKSDTTILIAPGTYKLTSTVHIYGGVKNVALRGAAGDRGK